MAIHGIMSSYFGDQEYDIGKSVRWMQYFCDTEFAVDINLSNKSRGYLISWERSFPAVRFTYNSAFPFFQSTSDAAQWRYESYVAAKAVWNYDPNDYVIFVDCTEGLCIDTVNNPDPNPDPVISVRPVDEFDLPIYSQNEIDAGQPAIDLGGSPVQDDGTGVGDYSATVLEFDWSPPDPGEALPNPNAALGDENPFKAWVQAEIDNADATLGGAGSANIIHLPVWAYLYDSGAYTVDRVIDPAFQAEIDALSEGQTIRGLSKEDATAANTTVTTTARSRYGFVGYSPRIFKVSELDSWGSDTGPTGWGMIDEFSSGATTGGDEDTPEQILSLVTYAYARWSSDPSNYQFHPRLPNDESTDEGWKMRQKISAIRDIGLETNTWPGSDPEDGAVDPVEEYWGWQEPDLDIGNASSNIGGFDAAFADDYSTDFMSFDAEPIVLGSTAWGGKPELATPLYDNVFRDNPRDGLFYLSDELGPVPWNFVANQPAARAEEQQEVSEIPEGAYYPSLQVRP